MVNPIPVNFEKQENKEQDTPFIPIIEETRTVDVPETCPLWEQTKDFYTRNFPTDDVTFQVRMPVLGLISTLIALHFFIITVGFGMGWGWNRFQSYAFILYFAYFAIAASVALELWWGLKTKDKKHINVWILFKSLEIFATIFAFLYYIYDQHRHLESLTLFYYAPTMGLNSWIFYSVLLHVKPFRNSRHFSEDYISTISRP